MGLTKDIIIGKAVGDALGVPVEFYDRSVLNDNPVITMREYGSHKQPKGTWSDDTSMALCIIDGINKHGEYNLQEIANNFSNWLFNNEFTPHGEVFDYGMTTRRSVTRILNGIDLRKTGETSENSKGNGALMRVLALIPLLKTIDDIDERWRVIIEVSGLTHNTLTNHIACMFITEYALVLDEFKNGIFSEFVAYQAFVHTQDIMTEFLLSNSVPANGFERILSEEFENLPINEIHSSGYVIHTLEASIWCLIRNVDFEETVLAAVNLGDDSDTTGAVAGGLAGLLYGYDSIPRDWINDLTKINYLEGLSDTHDDIISKINNDK